jgi:hypothetical protein
MRLPFGSLLALLLSFQAASAATCTVAKLTTLPATLLQGKIFVPVTMNEATGLFELDTGSAETLVNTHFADMAGAGMDRRAGQYEYTGAGGKSTLPVFKGHVRMTHIGDIPAQDWEYAIVDLSGSLERELPGAGGILGMDLLHYFDFQVDFVTRTVSIYRLKNCTDAMQPPSWAGDFDAIPLKHMPDHNLSLPIFLDNAFLDAELDTGWGGMPQVTKAAAAKAGVDAAALAHDPGLHGFGVGGAFSAYQHRFGMFLIGGGVYPNAVLAVENEPARHGEPDAILGLSAFKAQRIWVSFTTNTLFVQGAPKGK